MPEPFLEMLAHELVVVQVRVCAIDTVDLFRLAGAERLVPIETPRIRQQALAAQDLVQARDAATKTVRRIEKRGIGIRHFDIDRHHSDINSQRELQVLRRGQTRAHQRSQ